MSGKFTFVLSEREASMVLDALDYAAGEPGSGAFTPEAYSELAALVAERLAW